MKVSIYEYKDHQVFICFRSADIGYNNITFDSQILISQVGRLIVGGFDGNRLTRTSSNKEEARLSR